MKRLSLPLLCALLVAGALAGCDAAAPDAGPSAVATPLADLEAALEDFDRALAADPTAQADDARYMALLNETLARHLGDAAPTARMVDAGTGQERRFGPFNIAFGQQQTRNGTLSGTYPGAFDVYVYNVTGTQTGEFEGRMEREGATVGALLRINGQTVDQDTNENNVTAEAIVTAPVRAMVGVAFVSGPTGSYQHRAEFGVPD